MTADVRDMSLGREGEEHWGRLGSALRLSPRRTRALVLADKSDVRREVRRRVEALVDHVDTLAPGPDVLERIHALAEAGEGSQLVWIEAPAGVSSAESGWLEALRALNRGRDMIADRGDVSVVLAGPHWLHELVQRSAPDLGSMIDVTVPLDDTLEPLPEPSGPLCWMHLSDLHVLSEDWEQDIVLGALLRDLPGLLELVDRRPQFLFVTGDLAARGDEKEYEGVYKVLERICAVLGIPRDRVFMVPGNHDVQRSWVKTTAKRHHQALLKLGPHELRTEVGALLGDAEEFGVLYGRRLAQYCRFTQKFLGLARSVSFDQPWRSDVIEVSGIPVGIASICTAWTSGSDGEKGRLIVGERQIRGLILELEQSGAVLRVALLHHPLSWLCEGEERELRAILRKEFDVVLHGHEHDGAADVMHRQRRGMVEIGAGAAYAGLGQDRYHGFWIGWLDPDQGQIELDAFTWDGRDGGRWRRDAGFIEDAPDGRLGLSIKLARVGAVSGKPQVQQRDATVDLMRRTIARVHSAYDFTGLAVGVSDLRATLGRMFVPLAFVRDVGVGEERTRIPLSELEPRWIRPAGEGESAARTVILGAPGSGKSTLCRYLAVVAARLDGGPVPLVLTVRNWAAEGARDNLLAAVAREAHATLSVSVEERALVGLCGVGGALLLIDGIDEVSTERRSWLRDCLHGFCETYPRVPVVVTSRAVGYDQAPLDSEFVQFRLEPFDDAQLDDFIERWYELAEPDDASERQRRSSALRAALEAEPRAKQLARIPLLATLIALVYRRQAHLPRARARLYKLCIDTLVVTWPAERGRAIAELDGYWQVARLEELALWMQRQRRQIWNERDIVVSDAELEQQLYKLLGAYRDDLDEGLLRSLTKKWRRWLVQDSGIIQEFENDRFGFVHLSLMEYLAGRGVLRECGGEGHGAIAAFVDEYYEQPQWRECLLLMLGSEGDNLELATIVVERLLTSGPSSEDTWTFLAEVLREDVALPTPVLGKILEGMTSAVPFYTTNWWHEIQNSLAHSLNFNRKNGSVLREWFVRQLGERSGATLLGVILVVPDEISATVEAIMEVRSDEDLGLEVLLDLHPMSWWGAWAYQRAHRDTWLKWSSQTPISGVYLRSLPGSRRWIDARPWVAALARRAAWISEVSRRAAQKTVEIERGGSRGLPQSVTWCGTSVTRKVVVPPAFGSTHTLDIDHGADFACFWVVDVTEEQSHLAVARCNCLPSLSSLLPSYLAADLATDFEEDFSVRFAEYFEGDLPQRFARNFSRYFNRYFKSDIMLSVDPAVTLQTASVGSSSSHGPTGGSSGGVVTLQVVAEAHAGFIASPAFDSSLIPAVLAEARVHNRCLNLCFNPLIEAATREHPLTPEQHALLLALGLAQYQTTHAWPDSDHWREWFATNTPPEYWLAAYVWHLCRWLDDPENPEHQASAEACLDRGDWPELVAELRKYPLRPTPPEVLALFGQP